MGSSSSTAKKQNVAKSQTTSQYEKSNNLTKNEPVRSSENREPDISVKHKEIKEPDNIVTTSQRPSTSSSSSSEEGSGLANQKTAVPDRTNQKQADNSATNEKIAVAGTTNQNQTVISTTNQKPVSVRNLGDMDRWQDADLSGLFSGLSIGDDNADVWKDTVDQLISRYDPKIEPEKKRKGWKTIRLFVSSTFKDMWNERDYLVKKVFPQLRQWCEERKLRLVECDLRWGVPKDSDTRDTLLACLSEIDRCREENGYPYFLNLTSERYGWVPKIHEVPDDIRAKYKLIPGLSVTASEIMVGGYWDRNTNALYMLRTPSYLEQIEDVKTLAAYTESNPKHKESLVALKEKLRSKYPEQVFDYSCKVESVKDGKVLLTGLEEMGETVLNHFKKCLEYQYPTDNLGQEPTLMESLKMEHETFMFQRSQVLLGRDSEVAKVQSYIEGDSDRPLVMVGFPGSGKSSMAAYMVKKCLQNKKFKVFYHFIGATPRSTDLFQILSRFFMEFLPKGTKMPEDIDEMMRFSHTMFNTATEQAIKEGCSKFIVIIDALNQMDDDGDAQQLVWLPRVLPPGLKLIVTTLEGKCLTALRQVQSTMPNEISINPLDTQIRKNIAEKFLAEYNKKLDDEQMDILVKKADAGRPLWLTIACEELRVFGEFRQLTNVIKQLPEDLLGLLEMVLKRIVNEYGGDLVVATLCLVETSRFGLLETELLELLAMQPIRPGAKTVSDLAVEGKLPMAKWALAYVGLRQFLRPCGSSGEGRLDFHHRTISKVVRKMFLTNSTDSIWWHRRLAEYFGTCKDIERKAEELPYQLEQADDKQKLQEVLIDQPMFNQLYTESSKQQLMKYWRFIGGYSVASQAYVTSLKEYLKTMHITDIALMEPIQTKVAWFLTDIGEYTAATDLLREVIDQVTVQHGRTSKLLANALHCIVYLLYRKALQYVYGASGGYRECSRLGKQYAQDCYQVHKLHCTDEAKLSHVLVLCGYFGGREVLEEARTIFNKTGDQQGLAQALYMLGEKNQYHNDMNVPIQLFTKSLSLCLSAFGKIHLHTARSYQLFGQLYWNRWVSNKRPDWLERCLELYIQELEILSEILGPQHVTTVRSREDVVIILQNLGRHDEANRYQAQQPAHHDAV